MTHLSDEKTETQGKSINCTKLGRKRKGCVSSLVISGPNALLIFVCFLFFLMWECCEDEEYSKGEVHSGMSAGRGISEGRAQGYRVLQPLGKL